MMQGPVPFLKSTFLASRAMSFLDDARYYTLDEVASFPGLGVSRQTVDEIFEKLAALQ